MQWIDAGMPLDATDPLTWGEVRKRLIAKKGCPHPKTQLVKIALGQYRCDVCGEVFGHASPSAKLPIASAREKQEQQKRTRKVLSRGEKGSLTEVLRSRKARVVGGIGDNLSGPFKPCGGDDDDLEVPETTVDDNNPPMRSRANHPGWLRYLAEPRRK